MAADGVGAEGGARVVAELFMEDGSGGDVEEVAVESTSRRACT